MFFPNGLQTGQPAECSRLFSTCKHRCWQSQTGFWWVATHGWPAVLTAGYPTWMSNGGTGTLYNCTRANRGQLCDISPRHRNVKVFSPWSTIGLRPLSPSPPHFFLGSGNFCEFWQRNSYSSLAQHEPHQTSWFDIWHLQQNILKIDMQFERSL